MNSNESFALSESVSDIPLTNRKSTDLIPALFGKNGPDEVIDAFEEHMGLRKKEPKVEYKINNVLLSPGTSPDDSDLLNELLSDSELYTVIKFNETWTVHGAIKMFFIYKENLTVKKKRLEEKAKQTKLNE